MSFPSTGEELDEWAREHGEPEHVGPMERAYRYAIGFEEENDEIDNDDD